MKIELAKIDIRFKSEVERPIIYEQNVIYKRRLDFIVEDVVLVEAKTIKELDNLEVNQILNYLKVFGIEVGSLINFGAKSLFFKRYVYTKPV